MHDAYPYLQGKLYTLRIVLLKTVTVDLGECSALKDPAHFDAAMRIKFTESGDV